MDRTIFSNAAFAGEVSFLGASFSGEAIFFGAKFSEEADFSKTAFAQAIFAKATFYKFTNFSDIMFSDRPTFMGAAFSKSVIFTNTNFSKGAVFSGAKFSEEVKFWKAAFAGEVSFLGASFSGEAIFFGAKFSEEADFSKTVFLNKVEFIEATFFHKAKFSECNFYQEANFSETRFVNGAFFVNNKFRAKTFFKHTIFEQQNRVTFDDSDLSNVSFADSDITRVRFGDKIRWGLKDGFTITEERWLIDKVKGKKGKEYEDVSIELVLSVYRNFRENYEFRLRYDYAGKFFIKEMELRRKYREIESENGLKIKGNGWFRRHFSLAGLYYHLSRYGESISRPTLIAVVTVLLSTLFWVTQSNPTLEPHFQFFSGANSLSAVADSSSTFVGFEKMGNSTQWLKGFERSLADFLPLLSLGGDIEVGIIDYIIKIFGGGLTFGLLAIALRRKFERKYTR